MAGIDQDLAFAPATELRELIVDEQITSVELTELYLSRIERLDGQLNSYLTLTPDIALAQARRADEATARGESFGALHGLPISIKDLQMTKGVRTTGGSLAFKDRVPDVDATCVARVLNAGAVMLGKTNTPEFGLLGATENKLGDSCRNPWNPERTAGGSSGGAGAATVAGLCALATGGDGGGSIRIPSSFNGIYGIKPTQGRVSSYTGVDGPPTVNLTSQQGPMTRTVRDTAVLLQVMSGYDPKDVGSMREPVPDFVAAVERGIQALKIGWSPDFGYQEGNRGVDGLRIGWSPDFGYAPIDPEVLAVSEASARVFEDLGCTVDAASLELHNPFDTWIVFFGVNAYASNGHLLDDPDDPLTWYARWTIEQGGSFTAVDYVRALGERDRMIHQFMDVFDEFDLLLSPTMAVTAFATERYPEAIGEEKPYPTPAWGYLPFTHPINTIGFTAASVPCGFDSAGMPIGLQIIGRPGDEETVLAASAAFEQARPWAHLRPAVS